MPPVLSKNLSDSKLSPAQERAQALALLDAGCDTKYVAKYLMKSERWVRKWRQRRDVGQGLADKPRTGRPSKVGGGVRKTINSTKYKRGCSTRNVSKHLKRSGHNISHVTVYNYMTKVKKWKSFRRARKQFLTATQRRKRFQFAKQHEHLSAQDWENYIFSDESTKYLFHIPNRQDDTVWGSQSENVPDVSCVKSSAKVMIWGAMGVNGLSNLHIVPTGQTVDSNYYIENILKKELKPALNRTRLTGKINSRRMVPYPGLAVFMQDGATPHTAAATQTWCDENLPNFIRKDEWPGNSPDLNCIENLWSILDSEAYKDPRPSTMTQLRRRLLYAWRTIPQKHIVSLIHSMPNRIKNVIKNKGGPSGY